MGNILKITEGIRDFLWFLGHIRSEFCLKVISRKPFEIFRFCKKILVTHNPNFQVS